jgi:hypothetical protein
VAIAAVRSARTSTFVYFHETLKTSQPIFWREVLSRRSITRIWSLLGDSPEQQLDCISSPPWQSPLCALHILVYFRVVSRDPDEPADFSARNTSRRSITRIWLLSGDPPEQQLDCISSPPWQSPMCALSILMYKDCLSHVLAVCACTYYSERYHR